MNIWTIILDNQKMFHVKHWFHVKLILLLMVAVICQLPLAAQSSETSGNETVIPDTEANQVLYYINLLRQDPKSFFKTYVLPYGHSGPGQDTGYVTSLEKTIDTISSLTTLSISPAMLKSAAFMSANLARFNGKKLSHTSSDGQTFEERMSKANVGCAGENLYCGINRSALQMVLDLLIDWRVPDLSHRKNLLNPSFTFIGISLSPYSNGDAGKVLVMDFSCP